MVKDLLEGGANVRVTGVDGMTPLHCAAMKNRWLTAYKLLSHPNQPADQFAVDNLGRAPIHLAVTRKHSAFTVIEFLSASVDVKDREGRTPLAFAVVKGASPESGSQERETRNRYGATVDSRNEMNDNPLHFASRYGHTDMVDLLIKKGANVVASKSDDETPLMYAVEGGYIDVVKKLVSEKAVKLSIRRNLQDVRGAIKVAVEKGYGDVLRVLVEKDTTIQKEMIQIARDKETKKDGPLVAQFLEQAYSLQIGFREHVKEEGVEFIWEALISRLIKNGKYFS